MHTIIIHTIKRMLQIISTNGQVQIKQNRAGFNCPEVCNEFNECLVTKYLLTYIKIQIKLNFESE